MIVGRVKCLLVLVFSVFFLSFPLSIDAQQPKGETDHEGVYEEGINPPPEE